MCWSSSSRQFYLLKTDSPSFQLLNLEVIIIIINEEKQREKMILNTAYTSFININFCIFIFSIIFLFGYLMKYRLLN